ncbi:hypothetical protein [Aureimonas psammosilenae]|uniref:hypothetical protein n=1 Tax=Aureimonas psammosilenae TaxID=2495496 RepID=UPI001260ECC4|nr:hypothetical protein [Aureimonas psammosilenae]
MATKPQAAYDRIAAANNRGFNATSNPGGLSNGGHRENFVPDLQAVVDIGTYVGEVGDELAEAASDASDSAQSASDSATSAKSAADRAAVFDPANYATKASPVFTGDPKAPTPATADNDTSIATTAFVKSAIDATKASGAELQALTSDAKFTTPKTMADAMAFVTAAATSTIAPDLSAGFNRIYTMGLNATLGQPANMKDGLPIVFYFTQDGTGSRTLSFASTYHKFPGGTVPTLSTTAFAVDRMAGICRNRGGVLVVEWSMIERDIR